MEHETFALFLFLGVALELGAELTGEVVVLVAVVPVLLPLVHVLRVLLLLAPLCANEGRGRKIINFCFRVGFSSCCAVCAMTYVEEKYSPSFPNSSNSSSHSRSTAMSFFLFCCSAIGLVLYIAACAACAACHYRMNESKTIWAKMLERQKGRQNKFVYEYE